MSVFFKFSFYVDLVFKIHRLLVGKISTANGFFLY